jgi:hypothetical protein
VPSLWLFLGVAHRVSDQFAEANLGMHLADDITQFWMRLQEVINLLDLLQDMEGLFADRFTFWRAVPRASTGILRGGGRKNRSNRRREDATGPFLKTLSRLSITTASAGLECVAQANRDIDRRRHRDEQHRRKFRTERAPSVCAFDPPQRSQRPNRQGCRRRLRRESLITSVRN